MSLVESWEDIERNIDQLARYLHSPKLREVEYAAGLIQRGICFVVTSRHGALWYSPSRFIGYVNNSMEQHDLTPDKTPGGLPNPNKDGRLTNQAISEILVSLPMPDDRLDAGYIEFCGQFGIKPRRQGQFGKPRKFWRLAVPI